MKDLLTRSDSISREYCCSIVRIGEVVPVEGSDFLGKTVVDGFQIVVRKDMVSEGDIMFYASNESELNERFLSINNQFEEYERNSNYEEVKNLLEIKERIQKSATLDSLEEDIKRMNQINEIDEKLKTMRGFFNKYGRVKMITLRKCPSLGYLFSVEAMEKFCPKIKNIDLKAIVDNTEADKDFDTVDGELFVKAYVPRVKESSRPRTREEKRQKKVDKFDRIVPNQFVFHYDTQQLNKNMHKINPTDKVYISVKEHGTSFICGNLKVRSPRVYKGFLGKFRTFINVKLPNKLKKFDEVYDDVYSSRTVIKNQYINTDLSTGFYKTDIWGEYQKYLKGHIPNGMTVYGEIVGYLTNSESMIQKDYDYGCSIGENKLMIYRVTTDENGVKREWEINEVIEFINTLMKDEELSKHLLPYPLLYEGTLSELYPSVPIDDNWRDTVLELLKIEKKFKMEKKEPLCKNSVPREGIVIRIANDPMKEAFKLKCSAFLKKESELIDNGEVDMETSMRYE